MVITKALFLDVDGVLNREGTKERIRGYIGLDKELVELFLKWRTGKDIWLVLSSTWRLYGFMQQYLYDNGIIFISTTPSLSFRGDEIDAWLSENKHITNFAILDDNNWFHRHQLKHLVLTDPKLGVTEENLEQVDRILNE